VPGGCTYTQARCFCQRPFGAGADAGRTWQCFGPPQPDAGADAGAACPAGHPEGGTTCTDAGQVCRYGANSTCFCFDQGAQNDWFCFNF
jgi:hypothetical protein